MIIFKLLFIKRKDIVQFPWEQPNLPFIAYKNPLDGKHQLIKTLCDFNKKRVFVKLFNRDFFKIVPIQNFFCEAFNIPTEDIIARYDECFFDLIDDLKRNLHNRQGQLVKFECCHNQFGFSKVNGAKNWEVIEL